MRVISFAVLMVLAVLVLSGQKPTHTPVSVITDWTDHHLLFPESDSIARMAEVRRDPRYGFQSAKRRWSWLSRDQGQSHRDDRDGHWDRDDQASTRDWSLSLGIAGVGPQAYPSKFTFDVGATPSCTGDFVVTGISATTASSGQANIIGVNNLYSGTPAGLCGAAPTVMFAYYTAAGATGVRSSVVMSLTGSKLAFNETAGYFDVLTRPTRTTGNGTSATAAVLPGASGSGSSITRLNLNEGTTTTPFVDYLNDVAYVTTTTRVHKIAHVFNGTPAEVGTGGWPFTISGATGLSTPVFDQITKHVFFKDFNGTVRYIDDALATAVLSPTTFVLTPGTDGSSRPVIVDSTNGKVYAITNGATGSSSFVGQADTSLGTQVLVNVGDADSAGRTSFAPDFNNYYYAGTLGSAYLYAVGNDGSGNLRPALYRIGFTTGWRMNATTANGPLVLTTNSAGISSSPLTEFYNVTLARDFLFVGITNNCTNGGGGVTGGCIRSIDITNPAATAWPTTTSINSVILGAAGGTSGITVDNNSGSAQASSVYYVTMGATGGLYYLVKATQSALN